jgi:25S rRNA (adenine2142-N1)-methyltransferase
MGVSRKPKHQPKSLARGRPPFSKSTNASISRKAARELINKHHRLEKQRQQALRSGDEPTAAKISAEIDALGGLDRYQQASLLGQSKARGGDSSTVLLEWLAPYIATLRKEGGAARIRMLEVGALSTDNACSTSGDFDNVRIDLNSQGPGIIKQDFMERPLPTDASGRFDIISLSLVLNFVPDPVGRGEMLRRTTRFLREPSRSPAGDSEPVPSLFLVLPRSCVLNSRYCTEERLEQIMSSLGYSKLHSKVTQKLVYYLWRLDTTTPPREAQAFAKKEVNAGPKRNNFAVVLDAQSPG